MCWWKKIFLPPLSLLTGSVNWENNKIILREAATENGSVKLEEIAIGYGLLFEVLVDFLIIGFTVFLVVKFMNSIRNKAQDPNNETVSTPKDIELLNRIAEILEKQMQLLEKNSIQDSN